MAIRERAPAIHQREQKPVPDAVASGLYREKTERKTGSTAYLDMTIHNALKKRRNPPMRR